MNSINETNQKRKRFAALAILGCVVLFILLIILIPLALFFPLQITDRWVGPKIDDPIVDLTQPDADETVAEQVVLPTLTPSARLTADPASATTAQSDPQLLGLEAGSLTSLYKEVNPGVVNIQVYLEDRGAIGAGAGSGFILDEEGHIVTNNHVVANAQQITVVFYNDIERQAELIGTDDDSDLAIIQVNDLPEGTHPLPLGDSNNIEVGEWVVAIGNPFGQEGSMSLGIVSALGRTIPSGVTPFAISEAIQTDAAINPGNSGGPLLNIRGEVIGVNAQIASAGTLANSGVGFAIPVNIVRRVAPVLIETGSYQWPWLGIQGSTVSLPIMQANDLPTQQGAYIDQVIPSGPADEGGLQGTSRTVEVGGLEVPVGGDVVIAVDGQPIASFDDLLSYVAQKNVGEEVGLTVLRDGQQQQLTLELAPRPENDFANIVR
jgi:2-alkenal reductase